MKCFISIIILAAGESKRMGMTKQLMPLGRTTILEQVIDNFLGSKAEEFIVVVGHSSQKIIKNIRNRPVKVALNTFYKQGVSTSIITGLNLADKKAKGFMFALADQPLIDSKTVDSLIQAFFRHSKGIVVPLYRDIRGHPVIFSSNYKRDLMALKGDVGGRELITKHPKDVLNVNVNCSGVVQDIDTLDEYIEVTKKHSFR